MYSPRHHDLYHVHVSIHRVSMNRPHCKSAEREGGKIQKDICSINRCKYGGEEEYRKIFQAGKLFLCTPATNLHLTHSKLTQRWRFDHYVNFTVFGLCLILVSLSLRRWHIWRLKHYALTRNIFKR